MGGQQTADTLIGNACLLLIDQMKKGKHSRFNVNVNLCMGFFIYFCDIRQLIIDIQLIRTHRIVQRYRWEDWIVWQTMVVYESDKQRRGSWCGLWPWFCFDFCICCWEHLQKDSGVTRYERYIYVNIERFISSYICLCIFTLSLRIYPQIAPIVRKYFMHTDPQFTINNLTMLLKHI